MKIVPTGTAGAEVQGVLPLRDNRTTMHRRDAFDPAVRRIMHRTQIKGASAPRRASV